MKSAHQMPFGSELGFEGVRFSIWAPSADAVDVRIYADAHRSAEQRLKKDASGWHKAIVKGTRPGTRYSYLVDGLVVPDPASRSNPDGVGGPSVVVDPSSFIWSDEGWTGRPWAEAVIYELHVGAFTLEGTFEAATRKLESLAELGVTAIEIMPVAAFSGRWGWGYDGVLLFAPHSAYGTPDDLKALVDRAHSLGLMVLLDVVYNHFGPEGNLLPNYCPEFFNATHQTPWGSAINFDGPMNSTVRDFYVHNALYWIEEFHFDGIRMDAVHAIRDESPTHIVHEIAAAFEERFHSTRHVHLVIENDANQASKLRPDPSRRLSAATAQWNDDFHHAAHVILTGETESYYGDFQEATVQLLGRALAEGFVYQGQPSKFKKGEARGEPSGDLPSSAFVSFLQNHDQIGNRAMGDRLTSMSSTAKLDALYAVLLLSPHVPMLFMGEESAASTPFTYFCDFGPDLAEAVRKGRQAEFSHFEAFRDSAARNAIPDPTAQSTFDQAKLREEDASETRGNARRQLLKSLLTQRFEHLVPRLGRGTASGSYDVEDSFLRVSWILEDGSRWSLFANFGNRTRSLHLETSAVIYSRCVARDRFGEIQFAPNGVMATLRVSARSSNH